MRLLRIPTQSSTRTSNRPATSTSSRVSSQSLRGTPIRLRVSPTIETLPIPRATSLPRQFTFAAFARSLRDASDRDAIVQVEAFCAQPPVRVVAPPAEARVEPLPPAPSEVPVPTPQEQADLDAIRQAANTPVARPVGDRFEALKAQLDANREGAVNAPPPTPQSPSTSQTPAGVRASSTGIHSHALFDNMAFATTFDAGTVSLDRRFRAMDAQLDRERGAAARAHVHSHAESVIDDAMLARDLSAMRAASVMAMHAGHGVVEAPAPAPVPVPTQTPAPPMPVVDPLTTTEIALEPATGGRSIEVTALNPGDIVVSTVLTSPASAAIRFGTGSPVSHSMLYLGNGEVAEAIESGVVVRSVFDAVNESELAVAFRVPGLTAEQAGAVVAFARSQKGKPYNFFGIVRHAVFRLDELVYCSNKTGVEREQCRQWLGRALIGPGNTDSFICSQLVLESYRQAGIPLTANPPLWSSPGDLAELALTFPLAYVGHLKAPIPSKRP